MCRCPSSTLSLALVRSWVKCMHPASPLPSSMSTSLLLHPQHAVRRRAVFSIIHDFHSSVRRPQKHNRRQSGRCGRGILSWGSVRLAVSELERLRPPTAGLHTGSAVWASPVPGHLCRYGMFHNNPVLMTKELRAPICTCCGTAPSAAEHAAPRLQSQSLTLSPAHAGCSPCAAGTPDALEY